MSRIMLIGTGGCGGKLVNTAIGINRTNLNLNNEYDYLFINSNKNEMRNLKFYNPQMGLELMGNGTGRNRSMAQESFKLEQNKVGNYFSKIKGTYDMYEIFTSADGGFGSGTCAPICKVIRRLNPNAIINVRAVMPRLSSKRINLENALALYGELATLIKNEVINNIQFINNEKMKNEDNFNLSVMRLLVESMELSGGAVDSNDMLRVNGGGKYKNVLKLDSNCVSLEDAIDEAVNKSPFIVTDVTTCTHIGAVLVKGDFCKEDIYGTIYYKDFDKIDYGNEENETNMIVITGCQLPISYIKIVEKELEDSQRNDIDANDDLDYKPSINSNRKARKFEVEVAKIETIDDLFSDDFWER